MVACTVQGIFEDAHTHALHENNKVITCVVHVPSPRPVKNYIKQQRCPCHILCECMQTSNGPTLFTSLNSLTLAAVFDSLAATPSAIHSIQFGAAGVALLQTGAVAVFSKINPLCTVPFPPTIKVRAIATTWNAVAALDDEGVVHTWGLPFHGGDSSHIQHLLTNVTEIEATSPTTFRAHRTDGSVIGWGGAE